MSNRNLVYAYMLSYWPEQSKTGLKRFYTLYRPEIDIKAVEVLQNAPEMNLFFKKFETSIDDFKKLLEENI